MRGGAAAAAGRNDGTETLLVAAAAGSSCTETIPLPVCEGSATDGAAAAAALGCGMVVVGGSVATVPAPWAPTVVVVSEEPSAAGADAARATVADRPPTAAAADAKT